MKVVNKDEMEQIDRESSEDYNIPSILLMENAGIAIALKTLMILPIITENTLPIAVLIGPGNNGGDGLVIARYFFVHHIPVKVFIIGSEEKFKGDSALNLRIAQSLKIPITTISSLDQWNSLSKVILSFPVLIDALFGTGLKGEVRDYYIDVIQSINQRSKSTLIAVDVPSGLLSLEDRYNQHVVQADHTITVALPKAGMMDYPGKDSVGQLHIVQIGFSEDLLRHPRIQKNWITDDIAHDLLPKRPPDTHKGSYGHLLVIAGSHQYTGAAVLVCQSALRSGCGLVTLASTPSVCQTLRNHLPEAIALELPEKDDNTLSEKAFEVLENSLSRYQAVVMGPGVGQDPAVARLLKSLLAHYTGKILIDADGINLLSKNMTLLKECKAEVIVTPHIKEMGRLIGKGIEAVISNKLSLIREFSREYHCVTVLKSAVTLISNDEGEIWYNTKGNEGMATGGTGDVLAGIVGSLMIQGLNGEESAVLGVYLHSAAGDHAKMKGASASLIASDIISHLYLAFKEISNTGCNL